MRVDNFVRHVWSVVGASLGIGVTALAGWVVALGWLIGWGCGGLVLYGIVSGRVSFHRAPPGSRTGTKQP